MTELIGERRVDDNQIKAPLQKEPSGLRAALSRRMLHMTDGMDQLGQQL